MARVSTPDPLTRRHLLEKTLDPAQALRIGEAYLAEGRRNEAVAFLERADAREQLEALYGEAISEGDLFLLKASARALGREPGAEDWRRVGDAAEAAGKLRYAETASRQTEGGEG
ncbi:MAG: hypothetical protein ACQGVK_07630 [Myxococcota bacterium]